MTRVADLGFEDMREGLEASFEATIREADVDGFASVSGDVSPVHVDRDFALSRGFGDRVVHGAYLLGLVSRLVGVHLPGRDCLLLSVQMKFPTAASVGQTVRVTGTVDQLSEGTRSMVLRIRVAQVTTGLDVAKGKVTVRFTR